MLMRDVEIGAVVFLEEKMDDERSHEVRETFYRRTRPNSYHRLGVAQGDPEASEPPRFRIFSKEGYEYQMVGALPVKPIAESRFYRFVAAAPLEMSGGDADHYPSETPPSGELGGSDKREPRNSPAAHFLSTARDPPELNHLIAMARAAYDAMTPAQKAAHDYEQRRSFVRGMCPGKRNYDDWCREVDRLLPPTNGC